MTKTKRIVSILLRIMTMAATMAAAIVMATSHDSDEVFNLTFTVKYSNTPAFKYFVIAEAIASAHNLIVLFIPSSSVIWRLVVILDVVINHFYDSLSQFLSPYVKKLGYGFIAIRGAYSQVKESWVFNSSYFLKILMTLNISPWMKVIAMLLSSSVSAAWAIAYVGKKGNSHAGWLPICGQVPKFCDHVTGALIAGFVSPIIYLVIILSSL